MIANVVVEGTNADCAHPRGYYSGRLAVNPGIDQWRCEDCGRIIEYPLQRGEDRPYPRRGERWPE